MRAKFHFRTLKCLAAIMVLGGCAAPRSFDNFKPEENIPVKGINEAIVSESKKLKETYDDLGKKLDRVTEPEVVAQAAAPDYDPLENKIISVNMYDVDIGQLLLALAEQQKLNLIIDPLVREQKFRANLYLNNVTMREVYNHILDTFDLYGTQRNGALVVTLLEERVLNAGFLNTAMGINLASGGDVFGSNENSGSSGGGGGRNTLRADFSIKGDTPRQIDPYEQLENAVKQILGLAEEKSIAQGAGARQAATVDPQKEVARVPVAYSLNRSTGELYVKARPSQMRAIVKLVDRNKDVLRRQVQVEAQLIDIQLKDGFRFGVDWTVLRNNLAGVYGPRALGLADVTSTIPGAAFMPPGGPGRTITIPQQDIGGMSGSSRGLGLSYGDHRFSATINALSSFGTLRVLSNPSVRVRNGTPAMLSVGTNIRYVSRTRAMMSTYGTEASAATTADVETASLFAGVVIGVVPYIHDNGRIELLVHPMQTEVEPESLALIDVGGTGSVNSGRVTLPRIHYKGMTTTLNLGDGDMVLIGGLIDQSQSVDRDGLPGLSDIPVAGKVFGNEAKSHASRELVLVLRVRMI